MHEGLHLCVCVTQASEFKGFGFYYKYIGNNFLRLTSSTSHTLVGNKIVDHSDVVGASSVGAAPTTSSIST